ncbi:MAG: ribosomal protein S18-alanine N-acetyltransferase [Oscillospiraceae bacterium]|jgi:ribosomal-protein-alanine N-acetyltransferase|nr:ribosomal protein S18-alanine N-acetyltransferase [Oscillospiraceae bacterium]
MTILRLTADCAGQMAELEKECFSLPWSEKVIREELKNPAGLYFGAFEKGTLAGYAGIQIILDEGHVTNIATAPNLRRRGIARALLTELLAAAEARRVRHAMLEARASNEAALALYRAFGFAVVGRRKGYYEKPAEDAVLMTKTFEPSAGETA